MRNIRVKFHNFWTDFNPVDNIFTDILGRGYDVTVCGDVQSADYIFIGHPAHYVNGKVNILFTGEPNQDIGRCEYYLSQYDVIGDSRYIRFPLYLYYIRDFIKTGAIKSEDYFYDNRDYKPHDGKKKFCTYIAGAPENGCGQFRDIFVRRLMEYKMVDCPGVRFNNMARLPGDSSNGLMASSYKRDFISGYKFTIGFENNTIMNGHDGYTTEKLVEPMVAGSIPLYWGNTKISEEFNNKSFVNFHDYGDIDATITRIIELDSDDDAYRECMTVQLINDNFFLNHDYQLELMKKIFG